MERTSFIEKKLLDKTGFKDRYRPDEKSRVIIVPNFPELGRLAALRFLEWVSLNPNGVVSLPTGKTPEHFIYWVKFYLRNWDQEETAAELATWGFHRGEKPRTCDLTFVQMDEFYPIDSQQTNSFCHYVREYYIRGFGFNPDKALLIDCNLIGLTTGETLSDIWAGGEIDLGLRYRIPLNTLEKRQKEIINTIDEWCTSYEKKIEDLGGIGFFLGGIGPDGHIAFNIRGSAHDSKTRLITTNYETQAAAANDLGGIETAAKRAVITIGLGTITKNPDCVAIIMAAGESKAAVVAGAVQNMPDPAYPATALRRLENSAFYLTEGAAKALNTRNIEVIKRQANLQDIQIRKAVIDLSLSLKRPLNSLTKEDLQNDRVCAMAIEQERDADGCVREVQEWLINAVNRGISDRSAFNWLHSEPHHDDILLGYLSGITGDLENISQRHAFVAFTSGFTSVTNLFLKERIDRVITVIEDGEKISARLSMDDTVRLYLKGHQREDSQLLAEAENIHMLNALREVFKTDNRKNIFYKIKWVKDYLLHAYPGKKDPPEIQLLKGMIREWESNLCWGTFNRFSSKTHHLRLGFYKGDIFNAPPSRERDVYPAANLMSWIAPDIMSVALDPEASGPDTHYKVLQIVADAVRVQKEHGIRLPGRFWGYRNVWYRFHTSEANLFLPVSEPDILHMQHLFMDLFGSQREASFPSPEYKGPFSEYAALIQKEQFEMLCCCLGKEWFSGHKNPLVRSAVGFVFLMEMNPEELISRAGALQRYNEPDAVYEAGLNHG
jgi:glucosamine-6-phosphate deaminase